MKKKYKCCLCHREFEGIGNNPQPIMEGKCCGYCNKNKVIPVRLKDAYKGIKNDNR